MTLRTLRLVAGAIVIVAASILLNHFASAVSPATVEQGRQLFERTWQTGDPAFGSDGLGPLFNARSCVACHHQGGVGGGGDSRFNAKTVGIENLRIIGGQVDDDVIANMISTFHPAFVQSDGSVINTFTMPHHGGSSAFRRLNATILARIPTEFSSFGGAANASEVRHSYATPILYHQKIDNREIYIRARLFQRNTSPLFGAGLIDQVDAKEIEAMARAQTQHPEISGRPSTLKNSRLGRFGWRGNVGSLVEFVDQACANEVGLETRRKPQARDPMNPAYRNPAVDIADDQIRAMKDFIAALPAPIRALPTSTDERMRVARGEEVFASIGCAVCHVPSLGPAKGLYSDLLLHDMGPEMIDLNHAEPYVIRRTPIQRTSTTEVTNTERSPGSMGAYYGATTSIQYSDVGTGFDSYPQARRNNHRLPRLSSRIRSRPGFDYVFVAPDYPSRLMNIINLDSEKITETEESTLADGRKSIKKKTLVRQLYVRIHYQPTNFNQEWRTPPLWGLRDSAPYMHDGRAETLLGAITMHKGEAAATRDRFLNLSLSDRHALIAFLETMVAPPNVPQRALQSRHAAS